MSSVLNIRCPGCNGYTDNVSTGEPGIAVRACRNPRCSLRSEWLCEFSHVTNHSGLPVAKGKPQVEVASALIRGVCECGEKARITKTEILSPEVLRLYMGCKNKTCGCRFVATASYRRDTLKEGQTVIQAIIRGLLSQYPYHELERAINEVKPTETATRPLQSQESRRGG